MFELVLADAYVPAGHHEVGVIEDFVLCNVHLELEIHEECPAGAAMKVGVKRGMQVSHNPFMRLGHARHCAQSACDQLVANQAGSLESQVLVGTQKAVVEIAVSRGSFRNFESRASQFIQFSRRSRSRGERCWIDSVMSFNEVMLAQPVLGTRGSLVGSGAQQH